MTFDDKPSIWSLLKRGGSRCLDLDLALTKKETRSSNPKPLSCAADQCQSSRTLVPVAVGSSLVPFGLSSRPEMASWPTVRHYSSHPLTRPSPCDRRTSPRVGSPDLSDKGGRDSTTCSGYPCPWCRSSKTRRVFLSSSYSDGARSTSSATTAEYLKVARAP